MSTIPKSKGMFPLPEGLVLRMENISLSAEGSGRISLLGSDLSQSLGSLLQHLISSLHPHRLSGTGSAPGRGQLLPGSCLQRREKGLSSVWSPRSLSWGAGAGPELHPAVKVVLTYITSEFTGSPFKATTKTCMSSPAHRQPTSQQLCPRACVLLSVSRDVRDGVVSSTRLPGVAPSSGEQFWPGCRLIASLAQVLIVLILQEKALRLSRLVKGGCCLQRRFLRFHAQTTWDPVSTRALSQEVCVSNQLPV